MAQVAIPAFPYDLLVRAPLATLAQLATVMLLQFLAGGPRVESAWFLFAAVAGLFAVLATGLLQLYAIPRGIYLLWRAVGHPSQLHEAALLCGGLHLGFSLFLLWRVSWVC
jgi:hypothetical protein